MLTEIDKKINELFRELVPGSGKADTVAGEIIRAVCRIAYRNHNDGDHIGVGYGKETCNPAARYLSTYCDDAVKSVIDDMWGMLNEGLYDAACQVLEYHVLYFIERHPELREKKNTEDMWDYRIESEDRDYDEEDDDEW